MAKFRIVERAYALGNKEYVYVIQHRGFKTLWCWRDTYSVFNVLIAEGTLDGAIARLVHYVQRRVHPTDKVVYVHETTQHG